MMFAYRVITVICLVGTYCYWIISEKYTEEQKPKSQIVFSLRYFIEMHVTKLTTGVLILQLLGLPLLPFSFPMPFLSAVGIIMVLVGTFILLIARRELGSNWTHAAEYQVKRHHELITSGIYCFVRHPIYFGANLTLIGGELVAHSYIAVFFLGLFFYDYYVAKREEAKLALVFGEQYKMYQKHTKMLIPFIF